MTVYAMTDEEEALARDIVHAISVIVGLIPSPPYTQIAAALIEALGQVGISFFDYVTDNGDGTYTIDAELIQAVNEIICNEYIGGQVKPNENGLYNISEQSLYIEYTAKKTGAITSLTFNATTCIINRPVVFFYDENQMNSDYFNFGVLTLDNNGEIDTAPSAFMFESSEHYGNTMCTTKYSNSTKETTTNLGASLNLTYVIPIGDNGHIINKFTYSMPFPVFSSYSSACNALTSGNYSGAVNLRKNYFDVSSRFTGMPYTGGNIIVSSAVLNGISSKIDELNQTAKSTDEKMDELLDYINSGGDTDDDSGDVSGGDSGDDGDSDDDSIMGWLKKINGNLEKILTQVKQIKWLSVADLVDDIIFNLIDLKQDFEPVVQTMSRKFPFSIPWDTVLVFSLLADSPETPVYEIPFVIESAGIHEVLVVDLARFEKLSKVSRFMLTLTFLLMLFALTRKIASWFANR